MRHLLGFASTMYKAMRLDGDHRSALHLRNITPTLQDKLHPFRMIVSWARLLRATLGLMITGSKQGRPTWPRWAVTSRGSIEHRHGTGRPNDRVPPTASFPMDPIDLEDWDFLPFDSYLVPGSLLWQVCETSPQRAAQEFPHAQVVDDVQYDDEGWLTDGEPIRHFTSHCQVPDPE